MKTFNALLGWGFNKKPVFCGSGSGSSSSNSDNGSSSNDNDNTFSETLANIFT